MNLVVFLTKHGKYIQSRSHIQQISDTHTACLFPKGYHHDGYAGKGRGDKLCCYDEKTGQTRGTGCALICGYH